MAPSSSWLTAPKWAPASAPRCPWSWPTKWKPIGATSASRQALGDKTLRRPKYRRLLFHPRLLRHHARNRRHRAHHAPARRRRPVERPGHRVQSLRPPGHSHTQRQETGLRRTSLRCRQNSRCRRKRTSSSSPPLNSATSAKACPVSI